MNLQELLSRLESDAVKTGALKMTSRQAIAQGLCASCAEPAIPKCHSTAGIQEYHISGLCESCFDRATKEDEE